MNVHLPNKVSRGTWFTLLASVGLVCLPGAVVSATEDGAFSRETDGDSSIDHDDVLPIFLLRCSACHGLRRQNAGLDVRSHESLLRGGKSGPAIVPGNAAQSLLIIKLLAEEMPPQKKMKSVSVKSMRPTEIDSRVQWTDQGIRESPISPDVAIGAPVLVAGGSIVKHDVVNQDFGVR